MARDQIAARLVGLALDRGVDFNRADPSDRDWQLYLSLALQHKDLQTARRVREESSGRMLDLSLALLLRATRDGIRPAIESWEQSFERYLAALAGREVEDKPSAARHKDAMIEAYRQVGGDLDDPVFAEQARLAAEWVEAGNRGQRA